VVAVSLDLALNIITHSISSRELLQRLYKTPSEFPEHFAHTSGAIIMEVSIYVVSRISLVRLAFSDYLWDKRSTKE
jgi:hypothetical protein